MKEKSKRLTVIELGNYLREQVPPGISDQAIRQHINKAGLRIDKMHRVDVAEFIDAWMKHKAEDNKNLENKLPAGMGDGQDPGRLYKKLLCIRLQFIIAREKGDFIAVTDHHSEIQEIAGIIQGVYAQDVSEAKVLTGNAKLVQSFELRREKALARIRGMIEQNTQKGKT